jgi:hypothetical protein
MCLRRNIRVETKDTLFVYVLNMGLVRLVKEMCSERAYLSAFVVCSGLL